MLRRREQLDARRAAVGGERDGAVVVVDRIPLDLLVDVDEIDGQRIGLAVVLGAHRRFLSWTVTTAM